MSVSITRRSLLRGAAGAAALGTVGSAALSVDTAHAVADGHGLRVVSPPAGEGRLKYYRFATKEIQWDPAAFVLTPEDYHRTNKRYPVLYWLHGGLSDFRTLMADDNLDFMGRTAGKDLIVVFPDGGPAGWYSNPVSSLVGPRNWESFHMNQLVPWIDQNFRTWGDYSGRAVAGFSMGGHGAAKYAAKYYGHFSSVSIHSGPTSLRRDGGIVVHWANLSSTVAELGGGMVYGAPWDEHRVSMDNAVEHIESFRHKRIFLAAGLAAEPIDPTNAVDHITERHVLRGQREFKDKLRRAGIGFEAHEEPRGHFIRPQLLGQDIDGVVAHLRPAG